MEIKVKCVCGSVYSFEEEPVNGRLAHPVSCTNCGAPGTEKANAYIAARLGQAPGPFQSPKSRKGFLGFGKKKSEFDDLDEDSSAFSVGDSEETGDETSAARLFFAGAGALGVGVAGAYGWLAIAKSTGYEFGFVAWALGGIVGLTSRLLAPRGHPWLGLTGAVAALVAITGGQMLTAHWFVGHSIETASSASYKEAADYAKEASAAKTDNELRTSVAKYKLVREFSKDTEGIIPAFQSYQVADGDLAFSGVVGEKNRRIVTFARRAELSSEDLVTAAEISNFKERILPDLRAFASGTPSQKDYESKFRQRLTSGVTLKSLFIESIGPYSIVFLFLGIATAYKLARNPGLKY